MGNFIRIFQLITLFSSLPERPWASISQLPFSISQQPKGFDSSNHIFASLASLLQQWPNTYYSNGHTIVPGLVPAGTLLYHGTTHDIQPTGFEWLAFDAEMTYAIIAGRGGPSALRIYSTTRALRVLYLDGQSASIGFDGTLDSQYLLIHHFVSHWNNITNWDHPRGEYTRAQQLCAIGEKWGFEGIVRMNTGFELLWCNFEKGLRLVDHLNITDPFSSPGFGLPPPKDAPSDLDLSSTASRSLFPTSPFGSTSGWEWERIGQSNYHAPGETRVMLDYSGMVSLYDRVTSLARWRAREGIELERDKHRLITIDQADASLVRRRLRQVLARKAEDQWRHQLGEDRIEWVSVFRTILNRYSGRLKELEVVLRKTNVTEVPLAAQAVIYPALMPYLDLSAFQDSGADSIGPALDRCTIAFTSGLRHGFQLTESELVIISAIEKTLGRVCGTLLEIFDQILQVQFPRNRHLSPDPNKLEQRASDRVFFWRKMVNDLRQWLGWHDGERCPRLCEWDEQCAIPNWPLVRFRDPGRFPGSNEDRSKPICVSRDVSKWIISDTIFPPRSP